MNRSEIRHRLDRLAAAEGLDDPTWVQQLTEFDEPPLFSRCEDVQFLVAVPEKYAAVFEFALARLDQIADFLKTVEQRRNYFVCLTFMDWDLVEGGDQPIPTPSLLVSRNSVEELAEFRVRSIQSAEGRTVAGWLKRSGRQDLCVAEAVARSAEEPARIYVGYRNAGYFQSLGDFFDRDECGRAC